MARKERQPWERRFDETNQAFKCFLRYRDMEHRSIKQLSLYYKKRSVRTFEKYSVKYEWQKRVAAWDDFLDQRAQKLQVDGLADMHRRHIALGVGMQTAVVKELQALVNKIEQAVSEAKAKAVREGKDPAKAYHDPILTVSDIIKLSTHGTQLERLNRGEPTEHTKVSTEEAENLEKLSIQELKLMRELKTKLQG
jgi:hypothetical protein